ncbi:hypothetical protein KTE69_24875 [Burkholderia multivorans]|nr:hypothetical protein [Burkholderia multivorans]MBU9371584.1 hypothetical protein [Burkholderia multivorans]MBU9412847.1 hypothetical protein [Burkholderia multivorans]UXZ84044.1 hypothetical protein NUJ31_01940 [Burkholderia multivorans]
MTRLDRIDPATSIAKHSHVYPYRQEYIPGHGKFMVYRVLPAIFTLEL